MMSRTRGFTLIELLVVIAVIAILMAIMIPSLRAARELAVGSACAANQKSLGLAYTMYAGDSAAFGFADGHAERHTWVHKQTWLLFKEGIGTAAPCDPPVLSNRDIEWCWNHYPYLSAGEEP
jgi:prepilin-type N-terminal cleavage/methylation domain-containing protein